MANTRCFVQFPHPGRECEPDSSERKCWSRISNNHCRKFLEFRGQWIDGDNIGRCGSLRAWGEWEAESDLLCRLATPCRHSLYPRYLWHPYYVPKDNYRWLHNTDPFVFGDKFLYSNCRQKKNSGLTRLGCGSVIVFGSGKKVAGEWKWLLDTVLVVADSFEYYAPVACRMLVDTVPEQFLSVTAGPIADNQKTPLRIYKGATPDDPVDGMFSFFPAMAAHGEVGFPRPPIELPIEFLNSRNCRAPKGLGRERTIEELRTLWDSVVFQVRQAGLLLGTYASLPERRNS